MAITATTASVKVPTYSSPLVAVCNGRFYYGYPGTDIFEAGNQTTAPLRSTITVSQCYLNLTVFAVDGLNIATLPLSTLDYTPYAPAAWVSGTSYTDGQFVSYSGNFYENILATSGTTPPSSDTTHWQFAGTPPTNCSLCCNWRGRFVLAGDSANPQNFYMARVGQPLDWNYSATDPAAAVAGNLSESGQIGEPIIALIPYTDDYMLIGCTNSLWMLQGDPADGGTIVRVSSEMGLVSPYSWAVDPAGTLYFIARGGLYSVRPIWEFYQAPQLLSGETYDQYFQTIINDSNYVQMVWDVDAKYLHIFATPTNLTTQGTHLIFDQRNGGLWPQQYPINMGPVCSTRYTANSVNGERSVLFGGTDGYIRQWTLTALDDDGVNIPCYAVLGPVKPAPEAAILSCTTINYGEVAAGDLDGDNLQTAVAATTHVTTTYTWSVTNILSVQNIYLGGVLQNPSTYTLTITNGIGFTVVFGSSQTATGTADYTTPYQWNASTLLKVGPSAYSVTEGTAHNSAVITTQLSQRTTQYRQRFRGGWFSLTLANSAPDAYFSFESAMLEFSQAGRQRDIR